MKSGKITKTNFSNGFLNIIDKKYTGFNPIKKLISRVRFNLTCRKIFNTSPSFGQLWSFSDFIKLAEKIFFYNNKSGSTLFSSASYKIGENGFVITSDVDHVNVTLKLYSDTQSIIMEIKRTNGTNMMTSLRFKENDWDGTPDEADIILLDNVIGIINRHIVMLLRYCYDRRGSYDYERTIPSSTKKF